LQVKFEIYTVEPANAKLSDIHKKSFEEGVKIKFLTKPTVDSLLDFIDAPVVEESKLDFLGTYFQMSLVNKLDIDLRMT